MRCIVPDAPRVELPKNDEQINVRLPGDYKRELIEAARRRRHKHTWLARDILIKWLDKEGKRRKKTD